MGKFKHKKKTSLSFFLSLNVDMGVRGSKFYWALASTCSDGHKPMLLALDGAVSASEVIWW